MNRPSAKTTRTRTAVAACLLSWLILFGPLASARLANESGDALKSRNLSRRTVMPRAMAPTPMATINVDTTDDDDNTNPANCSLREAITAANTDAAYGGCIAGSGDDLITFTVTDTIILLSALPGIS